MKVYKSHELSNAEYHGDKSHVSSSVIKNAFKGKEYFEAKQSSSPVDSSALIFGTYMHSLILEPDTVDSEFAVYDGAVRRGKAWEQFQLDNAGKTILTAAEVNMGKILLNGYRDCKPAVELFSDGEAEVSFFSEIDGVAVKVRTDYLRKNGDIVDLKTTGGELTDYDIAWTMKKYSYHLSAALYVDVVSQHTGRVGDFYFVFLSKRSGKARCFKASANFLEQGRAYYKQGLQNIKAFYESPDVDYNQISEINLPFFEESTDDSI